MGTRRKQFFLAIVDDEAALREATESLLRSAGFRAEGFASAEDFLRSKRRDSVDCLILDGRLPGMSGLELQRHLAGNGLDIPIVFITADENDGHMHAQALKAGALAFLRKPFCEEDLLNAVRLAFEKHS
jgi:FixJ family two-component response regulator